MKLLLPNMPVSAMKIICCLTIHYCGGIIELIFGSVLPPEIDRVNSGGALIVKMVVHT
jgi:hypothetical protein